MTGAIAVGSVVGDSGAATDRWKPYPPGVGGPWGGSVYRVVLADPDDPDTAWAATGGGVFRWDAGVARWRGAGFSGDLVYDLGVCGGSPPNRVLAALGDRGLWASTDGGVNWSRILDLAVKRVAVASDCSTLWAAEETGGSDRLWRSADGGKNWDPGPEIATVNRMAPGASGLWVATASGLYWWADGDDNPTRVWPDPEQDPEETGDVSVRDSDVVVAAGASGLLGSRDGGATWEVLWTPTGEFEAVDLAAVTAGGGVLVWVDGDPGRLVRLDPGGGETEIGLPEAGWVPLALASGGEWIGAAKSGAFVRDGEGVSLRSHGLDAAWVSALAFEPTGSGRLVAAGGEGGAGVAGLWLWDPGEASWSRFWHTQASRVAWVGYLGIQLWAGLAGRGPARLEGPDAVPELRSQGIPVSEAKDVGCLVSVPGKPDRLVVSFLSGAYLSRDGGQTWEEPAVRLPPAGQRPWALAWNPYPGELVAAGLGISEGGEPRGGVYRSPDGDSWHRWAEWGSEVTAMAAAWRDPDGGLVLVGTAEGLMAWREKSGWGKEGGLKGRVTALAVDDRPGRAVVAAAVVGEGVYRSEDGGRTWEALPRDGLTSRDGSVPQIEALAFEPGTGRLVAAVPGQGLRFLDAAEPLDVTGTVSEARPGALGVEASGADQVGWSLDGASWTWTPLAEVEGGVLEITFPDEAGWYPVFVRFKGERDESPTYAVLVEALASDGSEDGVSAGDAPGTGTSSSGGGGGGGGCFLRALGGEW